MSCILMRDYGRSVLLFVLTLTVFSCSKNEENTVVSKQNKQTELVKEEKTDTTEKVEHWLVDSAGNIKPLAEQGEHELGDQEISILEQARADTEEEIKLLIQEMDQNLDNPEVRQELQGLFKQESAAYKQKILLLTKEKLKNQN